MVAAASIRPYSEVAFGILAPMFGLGLMGVWGGRYGDVPAPPAQDERLRALPVWEPMVGLGQNAPMADQATETMEIAATADRIMAVLLDFDAYPTWAKDLKGVTVDSTDDEGRAREVTFRAAAMGRSTSYTLRYDHGPSHLGWKLVRGDIMRKLDGSYDLAPAGVRRADPRHVPPGRGPHHPAAGVRQAPSRAEDHPHGVARAASARGSPVTRVLLFTGKGGVGKTTTAAATAVRCADAGLRTIVLSTDPAHSLADAFDIPLGPLPAPVADNLWGQQLDAQERMEEGWHEIQGYLREVFSWAGVDGLEAEELSVIPGLDEIFSLTDIKALRRVGRVGRRGGRLRAHGGDDPVPVAARHPGSLHGAVVPGGAPGQQGDRARAVPGDVAAGRRRWRVRERERRSTTASTACARSCSTRRGRACGWSSTPSAW